MEKAKVVGIWMVILLLGLAVAAAGTAKLMGVEALHESFKIMGLPAWFGYFIGTAEVAGGIGLLLRRTSAWAAAGLLVIMLGAIYFHLTYSQPSPVPAIVLAILAITVIVVRRKDALFLNGHSA